MRRFPDILVGLAVFGVGCLIGSGELTFPSRVQAQPVVADAPPDISPASIAKIKEARYALQAAMDSLRSEGKYEAITTDMNAFLILSGGGNAREDLESGRGVDPETFAALHAGLAAPDIADHLGYDESRRLTYQNKVVRMSSVSRLQQDYNHRLKFAEPGL
ncbi:MAG: hypothetical protein AB7U20_10090 [Planctomycetaceae bacterium]